MNFFEKFENDLAYEKMGKGEGTGPVSKILSNVGVLVLVYLLVTLIKTKFYFPAILLLVFGFTKFGHWITIGIFFYFIFTQYWVGTIILGIYLIAGWASAQFGIKNIKANFRSGKVKIDPFDGMVDLMFLLILQVIFFTLALLTLGIISVIFWVLFGIVILFEAGRFYHRLSSPWRKVHFPLMFRYASIAGYQTGIAKNKGEEFNIEPALYEFAKAIYPDLNDEEVKNFINKMDRKMESFTDENQLTSFFKRSNPNIKEKQLNELFEKIGKYFKEKNPRWLIAEIIENDYGIDERIKYLHAVIVGRAS